jgi:lipoprotein-anchoring transpeptidase ErfK/SrfK
MVKSVSGLSRRAFLAGSAGFAAATLSACSSVSVGSRTVDFSGLLPASVAPEYAAMYAALPDEKHPVPAVNLSSLKRNMVRQTVDYPTDERPGTIVVATAERHLYLVGENGTAIRYGIGVGRDGFRWSGRARVGRKASWPSWTPTPAMMERQPETREFAGGQPGGIDNPLGARALYIYRDGQDTFYRLHGTRETWSIGQAVSSGCVRLLNQDIIDLYQRCPVGTPIVVEDADSAPSFADIW